jgi:hypothetical protein
MRQLLHFAAACALALAFCAVAPAQDSPSLGDLARQAQKDKDKDKANKPAAKVLTNDDVASSSGGIGSALGAGLGQMAQSSASGKPGAAGAQASPDEQIGKLDSILNQLDSLDRATLAKNVLEGNDVNFPGRAKWEEHLFSAKQSYVSQGRTLSQRLRDMVSSSENLKGVQDPNDPRVKALQAKLQDLIRDGMQISAAFQAVALEGRDLAGQASGH